MSVVVSMGVCVCCTWANVAAAGGLQNQSQAKSQDNGTKRLKSCHLSEFLVSLLVLLICALRVLLADLQFMPYERDITLCIYHHPSAHAYKYNIYIYYSPTQAKAHRIAGYSRLFIHVHVVNNLWCVAAVAVAHCKRQQAIICLILINGYWMSRRDLDTIKWVVLCFDCDQCLPIC